MRVGQTRRYTELCLHMLGAREPIFKLYIPRRYMYLMYKKKGVAKVLCTPLLLMGERFFHVLDTCHT